MIAVDTNVLVRILADDPGQPEHLEVNQAFVLEDEDLSHHALGLFRSSNADYSDCVILSNCRARDLELYTFDKRLGNLSGAAPVPTG
jgi:predicted nucleic-acid-binding protein